MRRHAIPLTLALFLLFAASAAARAQDSTAVAVPAPSPDRMALYATPLRVGTQVRLARDSAWRHVAGRLELADATRLSVVGRDGRRWTTAPDAVRHLEVVDGSRGSARKGAKVGLLVGIAASAALIAYGAAGDSGGVGQDEFLGEGGLTGLAALAAIPLTAATTGIGALVGTAFRRPRWRGVPLPVRTVPRDAPARGP